MRKFLAVASSVLVICTGSAWAQDISIVTPFLAQPGAQALIEGFEERAGEKG